MKSGIYKIYFIGSDKFYVGSAVSLNRRRLNHLSDLRTSKHCNPILQRIYNKLGETSFKFEVLEYVEVEALIEREQFWIDFLKPEINIMRIARSALGYKHTPEMIERLKVIGKINANRPEVKIKTQVTQFKKGVKHSVEFCEKTRARMLKDNSFRGKKHTLETRRLMSEKAKMRDNSKRDYSKWFQLGIAASRKPVKQLDKEGNLLVIYDSIIAALAQFNTKQTRHLTRCCNGFSKTYKGYKWQFVE